MSVKFLRKGSLGKDDEILVLTSLTAGLGFDTRDNQPMYTKMEMLRP
jgi:hypothetical protein